MKNMLTAINAHEVDTLSIKPVQRVESSTDLGYFFAQHIEVEGTRPSVLLDEHKLPVHLRVFLPDGNRGRLHVKGGLPAKLWWGPPHPKMVEASSIILQYHGRIDHAD